MEQYPIIYFSDTSPVDASKLRVRGGRTVKYEGDTYKIQQLDNSPRKNKKYVASVLNQTTGKTRNIHWGASGYDDYYVHRDKARRQNFQSRHGAIKTKDGKIAALNPNQPAYYATRANWSKKLDTSLNNYQYIPPDKWEKIPKNLRNSIRKEEQKLGATDIKEKPIKDNKKLTKLYASARQFSNWTYMTEIN